MGGYGLSVGLVNGPTDRETLGRLHREIWAVVVRRLVTLVTDPAGKDVLSDYMYAWIDESLTEGYDPDRVGGFEDDWSATPTDLYFSFTDAAGLCYGEMYAALHWTELVLLEQWPAVTAVAAAYGTQALPPGERAMTVQTLDGRTGVIAMDDVLAEPADEIFFEYGEVLAYASYFENDGGWLINPFPQDEESDIPLEELPEPDRSRITALVEARRCDCQPCRILRAASGTDQ